jgi:hypothetical protein
VPNRILLFMASAAIASTSTSSLNARHTAGQPNPHGGHKAAVTIPASVQREHKQIHEALTAATKAPGRVGAAARELAAVLGPHFEREEQIALPPLGLLAPLAAGERPPDMANVLAMTDALRQELRRGGTLSGSDSGGRRYTRADDWEAVTAETF